MWLHERTTVLVFVICMAAMAVAGFAIRPPDRYRYTLECDAEARVLCERAVEAAQRVLEAR